MTLLAIDPGPEKSGWVEYDPRYPKPVAWAKEENDELLLRITGVVGRYHACVIEMVRSYGMAVGQTTFETVFWIGRFAEAWNLSQGQWLPPARRIYRGDVKLHLCGATRAKDANVRQALIDRYGPGKEKAVGLKKSPGPLYGMKADCWQALALAITASETDLTVGK